MKPGDPAIPDAGPVATAGIGEWGDSRVLSHSLLIITVGGLLAVVILLVGFFSAPTWDVFVDDDLRGLEEATAEDNTRDRAVGLAAAAAAATAGLLAWGRLELSRREHELAVRAQRALEAGLTLDRYTRAIEQLGHPDVSLRLGALSALRRLATESIGERPTIIHIVCGWIRHRSTRRDDQEQPMLDEAGHPVTVDGLAVDYREAITIALRAPREWVLPDRDLYGAVLHSQAFDHASNLTDVALTDATLTNVRFTSAALTNVRFTDAILTDVRFTDATLTDVTFVGATLADVDFEGTTTLTRVTLPDGFDPGPGHHRAADGRWFSDEPTDPDAPRLDDPAGDRVGRD